MVHVDAPHVEVVRDALRPEEIRELPRAARGLVGALPADDVDVALVAEQVQGVIAGDVGDEGHRVVEVDLLVAQPVRVVGLQIVEAAHGDERVEQIGPAEELVGRVEGAEARAGHGHARAGVVHHAADVGDDLLLDVGRVERLAPPTLLRRHVLVHPRVAVDAVDGEDAHAAGEDERLDGLDQPEPLVFEEIGLRGRVDEQRVAPIAVGDNGHLEPEALAVPAEDVPGEVRVDVHARGLLVERDEAIAAEAAKKRRARARPRARRRRRRRSGHRRGG